MMKKTLLILSVSISLFVCKEGVSAGSGTNTSVSDSFQTMGDSLVIALENVDVMKTNYYPREEGLPLLVLTTGVFHGDETSPDMINKAWFGVFKDRDKYYVAPTTLSVEKAYDAVLDDNEDDPSTWTGWEVKTSNVDTALVLISGSSCFSMHEIKPVCFRENYIKPKEPMSFKYHTAYYDLSATSYPQPSAYNEKEEIVNNYKLYIEGYKNGKKIEQLLASTPYFDDTVFKILFIGDIDNDGFPDLVLDTSNHYNLYRPTVYLSSFADANQLVKVVGLHESVGC